MKTAAELRKTAQSVNESKAQEVEKNTQKVTDHFMSIFDNRSKNGDTSCDLSNLIPRKGKVFFCQTSEEDGFDIQDLDQVVKNLEAQGFKIELESGKTYTHLKASW